jgi:uncharacterized protein
MNIPNQENPLILQDNTAGPLPWSLSDTWIGLGLLAILLGASGLAISIFKPAAIYGTVLVVFLELAFILPAVLFMVVRHANFELLGYRRFKASFVGMGCGLVIASYLVTILNNAIFVKIGLSTQANDMERILAGISSPVWFVFTAVIIAPIVEETFFRGFLFAGFRQRYGFQKAALLSSALFALAHHLLAALIPTFLLGYIFSHLYQKSNSIFPGMIMHFLVNAFGVIALLAAMHFGYLTPR